MTEATTQGDASLTMFFPFHGGWGMKEFKGELKTNQQKLKQNICQLLCLVGLCLFGFGVVCFIYIYRNPGSGLNK